MSEDGEIVVTQEMIEAGLEEFRARYYVTDVRHMLECVFRTMASKMPPKAEEPSPDVCGNTWFGRLVAKLRRGT